MSNNPNFSSGAEAMQVVMDNNTFTSKDTTNMILNKEYKQLIDDKNTDCKAESKNRCYTCKLKPNADEKNVKRCQALCLDTGHQCYRFALNENIVQTCHYHNPFQNWSSADQIRFFDVPRNARN